jgi:hypothetical protein
VLGAMSRFLSQGCSWLRSRHLASNARIKGRGVRCLELVVKRAAKHRKRHEAEYTLKRRIHDGPAGKMAPRHGIGEV